MIRQFLSATFLATALALILIAIAIHPAMADFVGPPQPCQAKLVNPKVPGAYTCPGGGAADGGNCPFNWTCQGQYVPEPPPLFACSCAPNDAPVQGPLSPISPSP